MGKFIPRALFDIVGKEFNFSTDLKQEYGHSLFFRDDGDCQCIILPTISTDRFSAEEPYVMLDAGIYRVLTYFEISGVRHITTAEVCVSDGGIDVKCISRVHLDPTDLTTYNFYLDKLLSEYSILSLSVVKEWWLQHISIRPGYVPRLLELANELQSIRDTSPFYTIHQAMALTSQ